MQLEGGLQALERLALESLRALAFG